MDKKAQETGFWYGCIKCNYAPSKNKEQSNENWDVFDCRPCPICGEYMSIHPGEAPEKIAGINEQR